MFTPWAVVKAEFRSSPLENVRFITFDVSEVVAYPNPCDMVVAQIIMDIVMCAARKRHAVRWIAAGWAAWVAPACAEMRIEAAKITGGDLWIIGYADDPDVEITLDGRFPQRTDSNGYFEFRVVYHPATCIATLQTPKQSRSVVVGGCGQQGPQAPGLVGPPGPQGLRGETGPRGEIGPAGERGAPGPSGPAGVAGVQGVPGEPGPRGPAGEAGTAGETGPAGPVGPPGPRGAQASAGAPGPAGPAARAALPGAAQKAAPATRRPPIKPHPDREPPPPDSAPEVEPGGGVTSEDRY
ncbi:collagen-like protein [Methylobacterium sp. J-030]|uniref:collagen-like protein n=1 Tax=Methylobacterium sp. J-030 TaxID=2836627 RepID=UPI001FB93C7E|nr:collagen-like protein [Methylobacterium sp. J-030]MCJ2073761.1 collagen-like protein [Methylobacterium sp. J-030]